MTGARGYWSRDAEERALDREDALARRKAVIVSKSSVPSRCACCREWAAADERGACTKCGVPFAAVPLVGLTLVR